MWLITGDGAGLSKAESVGVFPGRLEEQGAVVKGLLGVAVHPQEDLVHDEEHEEHREQRELEPVLDGRDDRAVLQGEETHAPISDLLNRLA